MDKDRSMDKDDIRRQLDKIDSLFTPKRLAQSRRRLERLWAGHLPEDRYPFTYGMMLFSYYDDRSSPEERLRKTLEEIVIHGSLDDDYLPSVFTGCRQATIPSMFGARETVVGDDAACEKLLFSYEDIDRLPEPSLGAGTVAREWLDMQEYMLEATEGRIPIHVTDMQGPMEVAGQLLGYDNMLLCALEDPDRYHRLLTATTDAFILFWKAQKELLGDRFVPTHLFGWNWAPPELVTTMSNDSMVMVSPDFFDEFYAPYFARVREALSADPAEPGGMAIHSCGDFSAVVPNLVRMPGLMAINASQMSVEKLVAAGLDRGTMAIILTDPVKVTEDFELIVRKNLRIELSVLGIWPTRENQYLSQDEVSPAMLAEMHSTDAKIGEMAARCGDALRQGSAQGK